MKEIVIPWSLSSAWPYKSPASTAGNQAGHGLCAGALRRRTGHPFGMMQLQEVTEPEHGSYTGQPEPKTPSSATTDPPRPSNKGLLEDHHSLPKTHELDISDTNAVLGRVRPSDEGKRQELKPC